VNGALMTAVPAPRFVGAHVRRLHLALVRSPHAHARLAGVDIGPARAAPGVAAVLLAADLGALSPKPMTVAPLGFRVPPHAPLAIDAVRYAGQPIAAAVADDRYRARDAADLVDVRYEPLPAVVDPERALDSDAPRVHATLDTNLAFEHRWSAGDVDAAFRRAAHVVSGAFRPRARGPRADGDPGMSGPVRGG
jgi:CO/xanthine dehydrogenase Mo-binding subunit